MTKRDIRRRFKEAVEKFVKVRDNIGSQDTPLRQEANNASMTLRKTMQELHGLNDCEYIRKTFKKYGITE